MRKALLVSLLALAACQPSTQPREFDPPQTTVPVIVENNTWHEATIYIVKYSARHRLGIVPSLSSKTFNTETKPLTEASFSVKLLAGSDWHSERILISPGQSVRVSLQPLLATSSAVAW